MIGVSATEPDGLCGQPPRIEKCEECISIEDCKIGMDFLDDAFDLGDFVSYDDNDDEQIVNWWGK